MGRWVDFNRINYEVYIPRVLSILLPDVSLIGIRLRQIPTMPRHAGGGAMFRPWELWYDFKK